MATVTSNGTGGGLASATSTWAGGSLPVTDVDKVVIAAGDTVTIDGTYSWGDDTAGDTIGAGAVNVSGVLKASRSVSSSLTIRGKLIINSTGSIDYGSPSDVIPDGITATLILGKRASANYIQDSIRQLGATNATLSWSFCGSPVRTPICVLAADVSAAATSFTLTSASHGWKVGDVIILPSTNQASSVQTEILTISNVSGATITVSSALTYSKKAGAWIGNFTRNVKIQSYNAASGFRAGMAFSPGSSGQSITIRFMDCEWYNLGATGTNAPAFVLDYLGSSPNIVDIKFKRFTNFKVQSVTTAGCVINCTIPFPYILEEFVGYGGSLSFGGYVPMQNSLFAGNTIMGGSNNPLTKISNSWICGIVLTGTMALKSATAENCIFSGVGQEFGGTTECFGTYINCDLGKTFGLYVADKFVRLAGAYGASPVKIHVDNCSISTNINIPETDANWVGVSKASLFDYINKDTDPIEQERYYQGFKISRDNSTALNSTSSMRFFVIKANSLAEMSFNIPCASGEEIIVRGYFQVDSTFYNSGSCVYPYMTISGLGKSSTATATSSSVNAWELFDVTISNDQSYDGFFNVKFVTESNNVTGGSVYFSGVPDGRFVTRCRHYGFVFDESNPSRRVNLAIASNEATAAAYTGATFTTSSKRITFASGTINTYQKLYDYSQAWGCLNILETMPFELSGTSLLLADGWTVVNPPALTGSFGWAAGTIEYTTPGTYTTPISGSDVRFTTAGSYHLTGQISGTIELLNTSGGHVSVSVPTGISYTNTGPNITVTEPVVALTVSANVSLVGAEIRIYDLDLTDGTYGTELSGVESCTTATYAYEGGAVGNTVVIQILLDGYEELVQEFIIPSAVSTFPAILIPDRNA